MSLLEMKKNVVFSNDAHAAPDGRASAVGENVFSSEK